MSKKIVKLQDVAETSSGGTPDRSNKNFYDGTIPWIKSGELPDGEILSAEEKITEEAIKMSSAKLVKSGTLLIAMYGATVGRLGILTFPATTNQAVCAIHPSSELDRDYLFYYLLSIRKDLLAASFGGAQPNISQDTLRNLLIPLPDLNEQKQKVMLLKSQFNEIERMKTSFKILLNDLKQLPTKLLEETFKNDL